MTLKDEGEQKKSKRAITWRKKGVEGEMSKKALYFTKQISTQSRPLNFFCNTFVTPELGFASAIFQS